MSEPIPVNTCTALVSYQPIPWSCTPWKLVGYVGSEYFRGDYGEREFVYKTWPCVGLPTSLSNAPHM